MMTSMNLTAKAATQLTGAKETIAQLMSRMKDKTTMVLEMEMAKEATEATEALISAQAPTQSAILEGAAV